MLPAGPVPKLLALVARQRRERLDRRRILGHEGDDALQGLGRRAQEDGAARIRKNTGSRFQTTLLLQSKNGLAGNPSSGPKTGRFKAASDPLQHAQLQLRHPLELLALAPLAVAPARRAVIVRVPAGAALDDLGTHHASNTFGTNTRRASSRDSAYRSAQSHAP